MSRPRSRSACAKLDHERAVRGPRAVRTCATTTRDRRRASTMRRRAAPVPTLTSISEGFFKRVRASASVFRLFYHGHHAELAAWRSMRAMQPSMSLQHHAVERHVAVIDHDVNRRVRPRSRSSRSSGCCRSLARSDSAADRRTATPAARVISIVHLLARRRPSPRASRCRPA